MGILRFIFGLLLLLIIVLYSVQNLSSVTIGYYNYALELKKVPVPVVIVIFFSIMFGFILAWAVNLPKFYQHNTLVKKKEKEIEKLTNLLIQKEEQIASLTKVETPEKPSSL